MRTLGLTISFSIYTLFSPFISLKFLPYYASLHLFDPKLDLGIKNCLMRGIGRYNLVGKNVQIIIVLKLIFFLFCVIKYVM